MNSSIMDMKKEAEEYLSEYFKGKAGYDQIIYEAMSYSLNIGGKRIRPLLMLLTYSLYKENYKDIIPIAGALEMIHTYSLIHDDLPAMDNDDLRRGNPTNHKVYGEAMAVLAGDGLLNQAMNIMFEYAEKNPSSIKACSYISHMASCDGMIGGQVVDIISEGKSISEQQLKYMHSKKTGALIKAAVLSGAYLADAPEEDISKLKSYGDKLGLTFQIIDDILDVEGDTKILGKKTNSDSLNNKTTFVTLYGIAECKSISLRLTKECEDILRSINKDTAALINLTKTLLNRKN
ncbi:MAG: polyprenyl synthetase family protein [Bacillota bacterium]|nr:polyprenyl synthetase family protein [Bacillota bacterium]